MASLQQDPSGNFHICFCFGGKRFKRSLKTTSKRKADATCTRLDENIRLVDAGRLTLPDDADPATFLLSDGKLDSKPRLRKTIRLGGLCDEYKKSMPEGALENGSLLTVEIHMRHVMRILGANKSLSELNASDLQHYVTSRSKEPGLTGTVSAVTIRKEVTTLGSLWNWAASQGFVSLVFPRNGLIFPKHTEKPPFQTRKQIERQIKRDGLSEEQADAHWDCLYLDHTELDKLLSFISKRQAFCSHLLEHRQKVLHGSVFGAAHAVFRPTEPSRAVAKTAPKHRSDSRRGTGSDNDFENSSHWFDMIDSSVLKVYFANVDG
jgi:hypothetical protein